MGYTGQKTRVLTYFIDGLNLLVVGMNDLIWRDKEPSIYSKNTQWGRPQPLKRGYLQGVDGSQPCQVFVNE